MFSGEAEHLYFCSDDGPRQSKVTLGLSSPIGQFEITHWVWLESRAMANYFRANIQAMSGYVPGEQPRDDGIIKLNTNENPYPPSPKVYAALRRAIDASLRLYPQPLSDSLCAAAAAAYGVKKENIMAGNGSDELLSMMLRCFVGPGDRVAYPVPTYSLYDTLVEIQAGVAVRVPFPEDFSVPEELARQDAPLTLLCNPNAPSGTLVPLPEIVKLAGAVAGILVVDEAYVDFAASEGASAIPLNSPAAQSDCPADACPSRFRWPACASVSPSRRRKLSPA